MAKRSLSFQFFSIFFFISSRLPGLSTIHNAYPRANNAENAYPRATRERNTHIFNVRHLPWSYPRPKRPRIRRAPALGLPWSYPGATLERDSYITNVERLPCTYPRPTLERDSYVAGPGAYPAPTLERLPGRLPLRTWPFSPSSSSFPAVLPPPSPRAPKGPKVSQNPPAPRLPWSSPWTLAGPLEGPATWRATWAAGFGLAVQFAFSAKIIRMGKRPNRLTAEPPTLELPWSPPARTNDRTDLPRPARREKTHAYPGAADRPTLHLLAEGRSKDKHNQPKTKRNQDKPLRALPWEDVLGKSRRSTAYPQQIVTTRLLYCLQDRFAQLSRLQRI
jgi:hypothetical protein